MPVSVSAVLTSWQFAPAAAIPLGVLAACYLSCAWRCGQRRAGAPAGERRTGWRRPARHWPAGRTLAFLTGLGTIAAATQGWAALHDDTELAAHMVQHLLLIMVAPPLLVAGRPVTLLLHTVRNPWRTHVARIVRSPAATALTWPPGGVALYSATVAGTHLTSLLAARGAAHDAEHVLYLLAGYLFFLPVIGSEPIRWRTSALGRYLLLLAAMPADMSTGAALMLHGAAGGYSAASVHGGGLVMLAGGDFVMTAVAVAVAVTIVSQRAGPAVRRRPFPYAELAAYNARLGAPRAGGAPDV